MSQAIFPNIVPSITSGNELATLLNGFKDAVVSGFSGTSRPGNLQGGGYWIDTTNNPVSWDYKIWTGLLDITIFSLNLTTGVASVASSDSSFEIAKISEDAIGPALRLLKERTTNNGQTLNNDEIGEIQFIATRDTGDNSLTASIGAEATEDTTALDQGSRLVFRATETGQGAPSEMMRVVDNKLGVGTQAPENTIHANSASGIKTSYQADSANGSVLYKKKSRIASLGQALSGDTLSSDITVSKDDFGADVEAFKVEVSTTENHTSTAHGTQADFKIKKLGATVFSTLISMGQFLSLYFARVIDPDRLDVKKDTEANLTTYALTATNGQWCFATDAKVMYQVIDTELVPAGSGGGGVSLNWVKDSNASLTEYIDGLQLESFDQVSEQEVYAVLAIPESYRVGKQIKLKAGKFYCSTNVGNVLFRSYAALLNADTVLGTYPNSHTSTNTEVTVNATINKVNSVGEIDLTDASGQINAIAVQPGDKIRIKLVRQNSAETSSAAANARLLIDSFEPTFS